VSQILVCDYCKKEKSKEELRKVIFKQRQKELIKYDVCVDCYILLTEQFNAKIESRDDAMTFPAPPVLERLDQFPSKEKEKKSRSQSVAQSIEDGDISDPRNLNDDGGPENPEIEQVRVVANGPETIDPVGSDNKCRHLNKGRILGIDKKQPYQICRSCKERIPIKNKEER
jgi:hypothetical protein